MLLDANHNKHSMQHAEVTLPNALDPTQEHSAIKMHRLDTSTIMLLSILECLHMQHSQGREHMPLPAICKRLELRMSTLQRLLTALEEHALVKVCTQKGRRVASLSAAGAQIAVALHGR